MEAKVSQVSRAEPLELIQSAAIDAAAGQFITCYLGDPVQPVCKPDVRNGEMLCMCHVFKS